MIWVFVLRLEVLLLDPECGCEPTGLADFGGWFGGLLRESGQAG